MNTDEPHTLGNPFPQRRYRTVGLILLSISAFSIIFSLLFDRTVPIGVLIVSIVTFAIGIMLVTKGKGSKAY